MLEVGHVEALLVGREGDPVRVPEAPGLEQELRSVLARIDAPHRPRLAVGEEGPAVGGEGDVVEKVPGLGVVHEVAPGQRPGAQVVHERGGAALLRPGRFAGGGHYPEEAPLRVHVHAQDFPEPVLAARGEVPDPGLGRPLDVPGDAHDLALEEAPQEEVTRHRIVGEALGDEVALGDAKGLGARARDHALVERAVEQGHELRLVAERQEGVLGFDVEVEAGRDRLLEVAEGSRGVPRQRPLPRQEEEHAPVIGGGSELAFETVDLLGVLVGGGGRRGRQEGRAEEEGSAQRRQRLHPGTPPGVAPRQPPWL